MNKTKWLGHKIDENDIKSNQEKVETIVKLKPPENTKELRSFLGAIQYMAKLLPKVSELRDRLRKLLKKDEPWKWGPENETEFDRIIQMLTEGPCLARYAKENDNMVTIDAFKTGLWIILWQKQNDGSIKPIAYSSRYLNDTENKNFNRWIGIISSGMGTGEIPISFLRKERNLVYRPWSIRTPDKKKSV